MNTVSALLAIAIANPGTTPTTRPAAILLDADGTLLDSQHNLKPAVAAAVQKALDNDILVMPATGRARSGPWLQNVLEPLFPSPAGVFLQGLTAFNADGDRILDYKLSFRRVLLRALEVARAENTVLCAYCNERLLAAGDAADPRIERYASLGEARPEALSETDFLEQCDALSVNKLLMLASEEEIPQLLPRLSAALRWRPGRVVQALSWTLEVLPRGASKGSGAKKLLKELRVPRSLVMAVGDGENDLEMVKCVGLGVAMGNACDSLKGVAQHVVATNDEDGVAEAIERFALGSEGDWRR